MSLVVIFCSLIRRLPASFDVQARPIGFPGVLLAGLAHRGKDDWIYINVFTGGKVLSMGDLERMASQMGQTLRPEFLRPASAKEIVSAATLRVVKSLVLMPFIAASAFVSPATFSPASAPTVNLTLPIPSPPQPPSTPSPPPFSSSPLRTPSRPTPTGSCNWRKPSSPRT